MCQNYIERESACKGDDHDDAGEEVEEENLSENVVSTEEEGEEREEGEMMEGGGEQVEEGGEGEGEGEGVMVEGVMGDTDKPSDSTVSIVHDIDDSDGVVMVTNTNDISVNSVGESNVESSNNGTTDPAIPRTRSNFRLVLRPLSDSECVKCESGTYTKDIPPVVPNENSVDSFQISRPVCRLPSPFLNYSQYPSGYCAETWKDCAEIENLGRPGTNFCEVKGETTRVAYSGWNDEIKVMSTLNCAIDENSQNDCLRALQEQLRLAEQRRLAQREKVIQREKSRKETITSRRVDKKADDVPDVSAVSDEKTATADDKNVEFSKPKESEYSSVYRNLEFLPYNPLPMELEELIFPKRSRPLAIFDDPYWPSKASCIKLVESLSGSTSAFSTFTGTYLSPEAKGVE